MRTRLTSAILLDGKLIFKAAHDFGRMQEKGLLEVKERIQLVGDPDLERTGKHFQGIVDVALRDGKTLRKHMTNCRGRPENPMSPEEVEKKAAPLMEPVLGDQQPRQVIESVRNLESLGSIRSLTKLLVDNRGA